MFRLLVLLGIFFLFRTVTWGQCTVAVVPPEEIAFVRWKNAVRSYNIHLRSKIYVAQQDYISRCRAKNNEMRQKRYERRKEYKLEMEKAKYLREQHLIEIQKAEKELEEARYRNFSAVNGFQGEAKILAISPYVRKAKIQSRDGLVHFIDIDQFDTDSTQYLKEWWRLNNR